MLDFCAKNTIPSDIELIPIQKVNECSLSICHRFKINCYCVKVIGKYIVDFTYINLAILWESRHFLLPDRGGLLIMIGTI
jgi:hypothetical protein